MLRAQSTLQNNVGKEVTGDDQTVISTFVKAVSISLCDYILLLMHYVSLCDYICLLMHHVSSCICILFIYASCELMCFCIVYDASCELM